MDSGRSRESYRMSSGFQKAAIGLMTARREQANDRRTHCGQDQGHRADPDVADAGALGGGNRSYFPARSTQNRTVSFILIGVMVMLGYLFLNTRKISSANAWPIVGTRSKSKMIDENFSSPARTLRAWDRETCTVPNVYNRTWISVLSNAN